MSVITTYYCCYCQVADTPPGRPFWASFRCCCCEVLVCSVRFPRVFEHLFSAFVFRSCFFADFACVAILLFWGPKLEVLLCFSAFCAGRAVLTAFLRVICSFFPFAEPPCANHDNVQIRLHPFPQSLHVPTMITSRSDSIHSRSASMCQP